MRAAASVAVLVVLAAAPARADFLATFQDTAPAQDLTVRVGGNFYQVFPTGLMQFTTGAGAAAEGFGPSFTGVCAQIFEGVAFQQAVPYRVVPGPTLPDFVAPPSGNADPVLKFRYVTELWGRHFADADTPQGAAAFQLAVWEILYDPLASLDVRAGYLRVEGASATSPTADQANAWLAGLTGDVTAFTQNPAYAGKELVGLFSPDYQDQIVVRETPAVPAPAGVVLGLIGFGALAARRRLVKRA